MEDAGLLAAGRMCWNGGVSRTSSRDHVTTLLTSRAIEGKRYASRARSPAHFPRGPSLRRSELGRGWSSVRPPSEGQVKRVVGVTLEEVIRLRVHRPKANSSARSFQRFETNQRRHLRSSKLLRNEDLSSTSAAVPKRPLLRKGQTAEMGASGFLVVLIA